MTLVCVAEVCAEKSCMCVQICHESSSFFRFKYIIWSIITIHQKEHSNARIHRHSGNAHKQLWKNTHVHTAHKRTFDAEALLSLQFVELRLMDMDCVKTSKYGKRSGQTTKNGHGRVETVAVKYIICTLSIHTYKMY